MRVGRDNFSDFAESRTDPESFRGERCNVASRHVEKKKQKKKKKRKRMLKVPASRVVKACRCRGCM